MDSQKEGGFFTFIMDAIEDKALLDAFKKIESLDEFRKFFLEVNPLYGLSAEELDRIYYYRDKWCGEKTMEEMHEIICEGRGY